ncbi:hypothetical protein DOTSEDRAFT_86328 [Dothistroma septosporum NZE10]|uniref:Major facilitator superfamily (MFS) profile domain-containing protein n=1 Tax=Dothistroma septosporum (strain NZE10 / CBS 128990) TaxID=675120 RepID=N1PZZ5_DOTSN|nr:hypothetical protein DOTSEDRAFT_86328 [Dothistroma septosporum NZE10]
MPDGGMRAWLQVLSGFMLYLNSWGIIAAYGVFQSFYVSEFLPGEANSAVVWIGTMQGFLLAFVAIFAGPILDRGHHHRLIMVAGVMLFLAQGVCVGLGSGQVFIVALAVIPQWFEKLRAVATGLAAAGSAMGGIIYPGVCHQSERVIGFPWAVRVLGLIALFCILVSLSVAKLRALPPPEPKIVDFTRVKEILLTLFCLLSLLGAMAEMLTVSWGLYIPYFFISQYAADREGKPPELSFYMPPNLSAGGLIGRILSALLADRVGSLQVLTFTTSVSAALGFAWIGCRESTAAFVVWSLLYGMTSGPLVNLQTPTIAAITPDMRIVGGRIGMATFCLALGVLVGNPTAGVIQSYGSWIELQ